MRALVPIILLVIGCTYADWAVPPAIGFRYMASWQHERCVKDNPCYFVHWCHEQSEARCLDAGYPKWCGNDEPEGTCGDDVK